MRNSWNVIGVMSGTSLDGLDIAYCNFRVDNQKWSWKILHAETIKYTEEHKNTLQKAFYASAKDLAYLHIEFAQFTANQINQFIKNNNINKHEIQSISSHGHTIFHEPKKGITYQIGCGGTIAALTGIKTISDFRVTDVALGGQGAPLVPVGDMLLFSDFDAYLNLGGFANISLQDSVNNRLYAFDICPVNIVLNAFAEKLGFSFDKDGILASKGTFIPTLFDSLNNLSYYQESPPKSLGKEWVETNIIKLLSQYNVYDVLHTFTKHIAFQIQSICKEYHIKNVLVTGGGALNTYLLQELNSNTIDFRVPELSLVQFKEALIFAFLGLLRELNIENVYTQVTGASKNSVSGAMYLS